MFAIFQHIVIVLFTLITFFLVYRDFVFCKKKKYLIEFKDLFCLIKINNNKYKYEDIAELKIEEDVSKFSIADRYFMKDIDHGRLIKDRIIFTMMNGITQETIETYHRGQLYKILKHINKFKLLDFDIDKYRPAIITKRELYLIIIICIVFYVILHI